MNKTPGQSAELHAAERLAHYFATDAETVYEHTEHDPGQDFEVVARAYLQLKPEYDGLRQRVADVLQSALAHVTELRDAWMRGAIEERDGKGGARSNRNVDVESAIRQLLAVLGVKKGA